MGQPTGDSARQDAQGGRSRVGRIRSLTEQAPAEGDLASLSAWLDRLAALAAEALSSGDVAAMSELEAAVDEVGSRLAADARMEAQGVLAVVRSAIARRPQELPAGPEPATLGWRMLQQLVESPHMTNRDMAALLGADETQISRAGRRLRSSGLAFPLKLGRTNRWVVTDKGWHALAHQDMESPAGNLPDAVGVAFGALLSAPDPQTAKRSADELVRLGIARRSSVLTRGSLVRVADHRLDEQSEHRLLELLPRDTAAWDESLLAVLGEWGSAPAAARLASSLRLAPARDGAVALAATGALRKLGGAAATHALARLIEQAGVAGHDGGPLLRAAMAAIEELITGGGGDATEGAEAPQRSERWRPDDPAQAGSALDRLARVLARLGSTATSPYIRQAAVQDQSLLVQWARANDLVVSEEGDAAVATVGGRADEGAFALVVDIGHRTMRVGIGDRGGRVIGVSKEVFDDLVDKEAHQTVHRAAHLARDLLQRHRADIGVGRVDTLVLGVPGPIDPVSGALVLTPRTFPYLVDWDGFPIAERAMAVFEEALGWAPRVIVDNDANIGILGEVAYGQARGCTNAIYVKVSSGIGAGLYVHGRLYRGRSGLAGEFGHFPVSDYPDGYAGRERRARPPDCVRCHQRGCLEVLASAESVLARIAATSPLHPSHPEEVIRKVADEPVYAAAVSRAGKFLGVALSGLMSLLDPEIVVLGGVLSRAGEPFIGAVRRSVDDRMGELSQRVVLAASPEVAGIVGGLSLAFVPGTIASRS